MAREMGPIEIKLIPLVAKAAGTNIMVRDNIAITLNNFFIDIPSCCLIYFTTILL